jgi:hypothetical protein
VVPSCRCKAPGTVLSMASIRFLPGSVLPWARSQGVEDRMVGIVHHGARIDIPSSNVRLYWLVTCSFQLEIVIQCRLTRVNAAGREMAYNTCTC